MVSAPEQPVKASKGFIPGRHGLIPTEKKFQKKVLHAQRRERLNRMNLERAQGQRVLIVRGVTKESKRKVSRPMFATTGGFPEGKRNRKQRRAMLRKRKKGPYSRGILLDAYNDPVDPGDEKFAVWYFHPCKGKRKYARSTRTM